MKEALARAKQLRIQARERTAAQSLEEALSLLDLALQVLEAQKGTPSVELYRDLAETYGMRGGVLRRLRRHAEALASYSTGTGYEQDEEYGAEDTYNLVNSLMLQLFQDPGRLDAPDYRNDLQKAVRLLRRQTRAARADDYWAQADLARCLLLEGKPDEATACIDRFVQLGGLKDGYATTVQVFRELGEVLVAADRAEAELFDRAVAYFRAASEAGSALERPGCFVLMPFGVKRSAGVVVDFEAIYAQVIVPAIRQAGLEPMRADAEPEGGIIHKAMFERLLISEFAVADLTFSNPNVLYELGVRHGSRARFTVLMSGEESPPFDVTLLRTLRYRVSDAGVLTEEETRRVRALLAAKLSEARLQLSVSNSGDNPIAALLQDFKSFDIPSRFKADVFREKAIYSLDVKRRLAEARGCHGEGEALRALRQIDEHLPVDAEPGALVDLLLSYRGIGAWDDLIAFVARLHKVVRDTELVREQLALALNRRNKGADRYQALQIMESLLEERGPSSEAYGIIGRVYKDMWAETLQTAPVRARGILKRAIDAYRKGFEADIRDAFPGINLLTLLEVQGSEAARKESARMLPIVRHAAELRLKNKPDYWDYATLLELSVLERDDAALPERLSDALAEIREPFEPTTTARNLRLIAEARRARTPSEAPSEELEDACAALESAGKRAPT